ncbi:unnamed protein product [Linum tenue]|uniref:Uncharacterized protein n=1 Tax=Linum tenue TaxID=586396 RepID=A0AAV0Q6K5_9ROSI|nr:unnamed protein product [Linum tenue]
MGNYVSCTLATPLIKSGKAARVVFPGGEVKQFREPMIRAAEIMFECPNFFLANSQSLHIGRRFSPLPADEELELGNVYLTFPMRRASSVVTAADMAVFFMAANSAAKRIAGGSAAGGGGGGRVQPEEMDPEGGRKSLEEMAEELEIPAEFKHRMSICRSRKPMLETIREEPATPVLSR